jgi:hypothetical protein
LEVAHSLVEQTMQLIRWVIGEGRPYREILMTRYAFVNGPLVHFFKHQTQLGLGRALTPPPMDPIFLPDLPWDQTDTWLPVLQSPEQSGILTGYSFLLRIQSNRGRVNRFYNGFLDRVFDPSQGVNEPDCTTGSADLTKTCDCQKCHIALEPAAAYWGRFKQRGARYLDPVEFPEFDEVCESCAHTGYRTCPQHCREEYVIELVPADRAPYAGYLRGYEFLKPAHRLNVEGGPRLWVERTIQDGSLANGLVSKMWKHYMRRPLTNSQADTQIRAELVFQVMESDFDLKRLIKTIVTHPAYRRIK